MAKINPFDKPVIRHSAEPIRSHDKRSRTIKSIKAGEILDSNKKPTVEAELETDFGIFKASVPSGVSRGKYEAVELRDKDGRGVRKAIENIERIITPALRKEDVIEQKRIDDILIKLDGTKNKSRLGANAILAVSIAVLRAGAKTQKLPLWKWISKIAGIKPKIPYPCILQIEGGLHGKGELEIQEFMAVSPKGHFKESFYRGDKIYNALKKILIENYGSSAVALGLEGAFTPPIKNTKEALNFIMEAIDRAGFKNKVKIILDAAASSFFEKGKYFFEKKSLTKEKLLNFYFNLFQEYPIMGIEDPFFQEDWTGWQKLNEKFKIQNAKLMAIGDDLTATNPERIKRAHKKKACNAAIIKPNQIGTISETIMAAKLAESYGWKVIVSHRSGETNDDFISDLAVGIGADFIKSGAPSKIERMVKYNRLLEIEKEVCSGS